MYYQYITLLFIRLLWFVANISAINLLGLTLMNVLNKIVMSSAMAIALISSTAYAAPAGEAKVLAAAEGTVANIAEAVELINADGDKEKAASALTEASQLQKEFRYELTERLRQKAGTQLKIGRTAFNKGDTAGAKLALAESLSMYQDMLKTYKAAH